jgi:hypothetical protein
MLPHSSEINVPYSVAEPCHFDTVPVQVPTSYFPSYGSGSGSLHKFKKLWKLKFLHISIETGWQKVDFSFELFNLFFYSDSF